MASSSRSDAVSMKVESSWASLTKSGSKEDTWAGTPRARPVPSEQPVSVRPNRVYCAVIVGSHLILWMKRIEFPTVLSGSSGHG